MPKISSYANDSMITGTDKWIGTDGADGSTKNFRVSNFMTYIEDNINTIIFDDIVLSVNGELPDVAGDVLLDSSVVPYDGSESGLTANNVQDAFDESVEMVEELYLELNEDKVDKDAGIELDAGKRAVRIDNQNMNDINDSGLYEGLLSTMSNIPEKFTGFRGVFIVANTSSDGSNKIQLGIDSSGENIALRSIETGSVNPWVYFLNESDKILSTSDLDLSGFAGWNPTTKTLDLSTKVGVGIINFDSTYTAVGITNITTASPAVVKFAETPSATLLQNDQTINFSGIEGGTPFDDLNTGDYVIKNIDYANFTFEIYESDGTTAVSTEKTTLTNITNVTSGEAEAVFTVSDASELSNGMLIEVDSVGGMPSLSGITYEITQLVGNDFKLLIYGGDGGTFVSTDGLTYTSGGTVITAEYEQGGDIAFKDGIINTTVDHITGLDNGTVVRYSAATNNEVGFNPTPKASATAGDIVSTVGTLSANTLGSDGLYEMLVHKDLNWVAHRNEFV